MIWFYNLLIGFGGFIIGMLTFTDDIAKKIKLLNSLKSLIFKIPFFCLGSFMIIWASIEKDIETDFKSEKKEFSHQKEIAEINSANRTEKIVRDSLYDIKLQEKLDSSYSKSIRASNQALAKYNLVLIDSLQTVSNKINIKSINKPQLALAAAELGTTAPIYISKDSVGNIIKIKFVSSNNTSYNITIEFYLLQCKIEAGMIVYSTIDSGYLFRDRSSLVQNRFATAGISLKPEYLNLNCCIILMMGNFSIDNENFYKIPFQEAIIFDIKNNRIIGPADGFTVNGIKKKLKGRNIIK